MKILLAVLVAMLTFAVQSRADTTYTYIGSSFTYPGASSSNSPGISGYFSTSTPLTANLPLSAPVTTSFLFQGSGGLVFTTGNARVQTDASGNINGWYINLLNYYGASVYVTLMSVNLQAPTFDIYTQQYENAFDAIKGVYSVAYNTNMPGTWTASQPLGAPPVPEPESLALVSTGLLSIASGVLRRKFVHIRSL